LTRHVSAVDEHGRKCSKPVRAFDAGSPAVKVLTTKAVVQQTGEAKNADPV
jgi:hypothetical protein